MALSLRYTFALALAAIAAMAPEFAYAAFGSDSGIDAMLCDLASLATSGAGKALATAAIVFLGIGAFFGKVNWGLAMMVALGIVLIFGAATIADSLAASSGSSAGSC